jgi:hypothetical protein
MGVSHRKDDIRAFMHRMARDQAALADALATVEQFNSRVAAGKVAWFWPTIAAALVTKHSWLVIACDSCQTITEMDLSMKPRDPDAPIRVALDDARCLRCNGHGRRRILGLARVASRF